VTRSTGSGQAWQVAVAQPDRLGESPFWHPREQMLYWVDVPAMQVRRCDTRGGAVESWQMPSEPGCIAPAQGGGLVIALRDGIYRAHGWREPLLAIARFNHDPKTTRFNDGKADPVGRFWAGTIYEPRDARKAELYSVDCRPDNGNGGKPLIALKALNAITANGLAWSADNKTVYWTDTPSHAIQAWDWEAGSNVMRHHRIFKRFPAKPAGWQPGDAGYGGRPDGAAVDEAGNYWCAMYEGGRVLQIAPDGQVLKDIAVPAMCPTMPCFGGPDRQTLFVTTASDKRPAGELESFPDSGCVFSMRVDVPGLPANFLID
jgi:sugar lactone lactonase YvrE